eukprot:GHVQ01027425.1.p1 GENE.GHVQ01027425.1~~GHVQ01027425.1.p1  ORF type:complete len:453 (+),score=38.56 GHVQ01027425.1:1498-2856(+)
MWLRFLIDDPVKFFTFTESERTSLERTQITKQFTISFSKTGGQGEVTCATIFFKTGNNLLTADVSLKTGGNELGPVGLFSPLEILLLEDPFGTRIFVNAVKGQTAKHCLESFVDRNVVIGKSGGNWKTLLCPVPDELVVGGDVSEASSRHLEVEVSGYTLTDKILQSRMGKQLSSSDNTEIEQYLTDQEEKADKVNTTVGAVTGKTKTGHLNVSTAVPIPDIVKSDVETAALRGAATPPAPEAAATPPKQTVEKTKAHDTKLAEPTPSPSPIKQSLPQAPPFPTPVTELLSPQPSEVQPPQSVKNPDKNQKTLKDPEEAQTPTRTTSVRVQLHKPETPTATSKKAGLTKGNLMSIGASILVEAQSRMVPRETPNRQAVRRLFLEGCTVLALLLDDWERFGLSNKTGISEHGLIGQVMVALNYKITIAKAPSSEAPLTKEVEKVARECAKQSK